MKTQYSFERPDQAAIERYVAQARQMRSDYIAQSAKAVLESLRTLFARQGRAVTTA